MVLDTKQIYNLESLITQLCDEVKLSEFNNISINKAKLSLTLTLISMAIKSIPRAIALFDYSQELEEKMFDKKNIPSLKLEDQLALYKLSIERQGSTVDFINKVLSSLRWTELESALVYIEKMRANETISASSTKVAQDILRDIELLKSKQTIQQKPVPEVVDASIEDGEEKGVVDE